MSFKSFAGCYNTQFPNCEFHFLKGNEKIVFNFLDLKKEDFCMIKNSVEQSLFLDSQLGLISLRLTKEKKQFAIQLTAHHEVFELFYQSKTKIGFSFKGEDKKQFDYISYFSN